MRSSWHVHYKMVGVALGSALLSLLRLGPAHCMSWPEVVVYQ